MVHRYPYKVRVQVCGHYELNCGSYYRFSIKCLISKTGNRLTRLTAKLSDASVLSDASDWSRAGLALRVPFETVRCVRLKFTTAALPSLNRAQCLPLHPPWPPRWKHVEPLDSKPRSHYNAYFFVNTSLPSCILSSGSKTSHILVALTSTGTQPCIVSFKARLNIVLLDYSHPRLIYVTERLPVRMRIQVCTSAEELCTGCTPSLFIDTSVFQLPSIYPSHLSFPFSPTTLCWTAGQSLVQTAVAVELLRPLSAVMASVLLISYCCIHLIYLYNSCSFDVVCMHSSNLHKH